MGRMTIGEAMKKCRERTGLTLCETARLSGVEHSNIAGYEKGEHFPGVLIAISLAEIYNVSLDELVGRVPLKE